MEVAAYRAIIRAVAYRHNADREEVFGYVELRFQNIPVKPLYPDTVDAVVGGGKHQMGRDYRAVYLGGRVVV